jgi:hypothetical protein
MWGFSYLNHLCLDCKGFYENIYGMQLNESAGHQKRLKKLIDIILRYESTADEFGTYRVFDVQPIVVELEYKGTSMHHVDDLRNVKKYVLIAWYHVPKWEQYLKLEKDELKANILSMLKVFDVEKTIHDIRVELTYHTEEVVLNALEMSYVEYEEYQHGYFYAQGREGRQLGSIPVDEFLNEDERINNIKKLQPKIDALQRRLNRDIGKKLHDDEGDAVIIDLIVKGWPSDVDIYVYVVYNGAWKAANDYAETLARYYSVTYVKYTIEHAVDVQSWELKQEQFSYWLEDVTNGDAPIFVFSQFYTPKPLGDIIK